MKKIRIKKVQTLRPHPNPFQSLVRSIAAQQLSSKSAQAIYKRFVNLWPKKFPSPAEVLEQDFDSLRSVGLSQNKILAIKDLAQKFEDKYIDPKKFSKMTDQEIIEHLVAVRGIGEWTAQMFLIFSLNRPNILPTGDLAIQKGFQKAFKLEKLPTKKEMFDLAYPYEGRWTDLALYLWSLLDTEGENTW